MVNIKNSVNVKDIWVSSNDRLSDFYASSWQRGESPVLMLVVRLLLAAVAVGLFVWSLIVGGSPHWLLYLTNWGLLLITFMLLAGLLVSFLAVLGKVNEDTILPWYVSMYWLTFNIAVCISVVITALFWILLYDPAIYIENKDRVFWLDVATHGLNSCLALAELLMSRTPLRLLHFYQPLGMGLWYAAFTAIYYSAGGTDAKGQPYIYEILDWRRSSRAGTVVAAAVAGLIVVYAVLWVLGRIRDMISTTLVRTISHDFPPTPPDNFEHTRMA
ncbi:hypothetical protein ACJJTC_012641 [Scirpophaga incertulas]